MTDFMKTIAPAELRLDIFSTLAEQWMLLTAGDWSQHQFNSMTVSWGMFGTMWNRPIVMVMVRPQRYTLEFLEKFDTFTLSAFPEEFRPALAYCGGNSGRDGDKIAATHLTPIAAERVEAPSFAEAELVFECRKLYVDKLAGKNFLDKSIVKDVYPQHDYHLVFYAEVLHISGIDKFIKPQENENHED